MSRGFTHTPRPESRPNAAGLGPRVRKAGLGIEVVKHHLSLLSRCTSALSDVPERLGKVRREPSSGHFDCQGQLVCPPWCATPKNASGHAGKPIDGLTDGGGARGQRSSSRRRAAIGADPTDARRELPPASERGPRKIAQGQISKPTQSVRIRFAR